MSRFRALTWLAIRELWLSFRLLVLLGAYLLSGVGVALVPADPYLNGPRYAFALGAATALGAGVAAMSMGRERRRGSAGWLVSRAVPRASILGAWFVSLLAVLVAGLLPSAVLAWLSVDSLLPWADAVRFSVTILAVGATGVAAVALGLLLGALLAPRVAAVAAVLMVAAAGAAIALTQVQSPTVPGAALVLLAALPDVPRPIGPALQAAGMALALAAALLVIARLAFERADL